MVFKLSPMSLKVKIRPRFYVISMLSIVAGIVLCQTLQLSSPKVYITAYSFDGE